MESGEELKRLLEKVGISAGSDEGLKLTAFLALLQKWNARIDLTSSTEWKIIGPLFVEALWAAGYCEKRLLKHLDIGSGAGFPAIPIRIMTPQMELEMVESREKRAIFLECASNELGLAGTQVHQVRINHFLETEEKAWDSFSWKAVKLDSEELKRMFNHAHPETLFWMFHGVRLPVKDERIISEKLEIVKKRKCPDRKEWKLSIYRLKNVPS